MKPTGSIVVLALSLPLFLILLPAQDPVPARPDSSSADLRLPSGRLQRDEMLKADQARNLQDAGELIRLSSDLKAEIEKNTEHVLSVAAMKKSEEIEKLARRIRSRMKRY